MPTKDTTEIKEKILAFLKVNGPSLPVQISREIKMDSIFASAFLSELLSQNKLKITSMKVGGSPLYYLKESKRKLEKPAEEYLKSKEKEAFLLIKEKKELVDSEQETAIRVALRSIKDFAIPKEKEGELVWEYFLIEECEKEDSKKEEIKKIEEKKEEPKTSFPKSMVNEIRKKFEESSYKEKEECEKEDSKKEEIEKITKKKINSSGKKIQEKKNEMFFNTVKEFLKNKNMEISDIISFARGDLTLIVEDSGEEKLLVAYNKKRLTENDILNTYKKAKEKNLKYIIYTFGEPAKKTINFIDAVKDLSSIEKLE
jgi:hypothetical protein